MALLWKDSSSKTDQYGEHRARLVIQQAEQLPLNDALILLRRYHKIYRNLSKGISAYGVAADALLKAQADLIVKHVSTYHPLRITEALKQWEEHYRHLCKTSPAYEVVVNELMIAKDVWQSLF